MLDEVGERLLGGAGLGVESLLVLLFLGDLVLGVAEVVDEALLGLLVGVLEGGDVGALTLFLVVQSIQFGIDGLLLGVEIGDLALGVEHGLEPLEQIGIVIWLFAHFLKEDLDLLVVDAADLDGAWVGVGLGDLEVDGSAGGDGDAEAVEGGGGLVGLGCALGIELVVVDA